MDFALPQELADLEAEAGRFARERLAPRLRDAERDGRWEPDVVKTLAGFDPGDEQSLAKVVVLEALAHGDAGGLPAADRPGPAVGALVASGAGEGDAWLTVGIDDEPPRVWWMPPSSQVWISTGDRLRLVEADNARPVEGASAFHASSGVSASFGRELGSWTCDGIAVRGRARLWTASVALGVASASLDYAVAYTTERVVFGKPVAHHQANAFQLAEAKARVDGARLVLRDAADSFDSGDSHAGYWATLAWLETIETALFTTDLGVQLMGGHGYIADNPAEKWYREARMIALLCGGRDAAEHDAAAAAVDVPEPVFDSL